MDEEFLILVKNPDDGTWVIVTQTTDKEEAHSEHEAMLSDGTLCLLICPNDFVQV